MNNQEKISAEEWRRTIQEDNIKENALHLEEAIETIIELGGNLAEALDLLRKNNIDHRLNLELLSRLPWLLFTLQDMRSGLKAELEDLN